MDTERVDAKRKPSTVRKDTLRHNALLGMGIFVSASKEIPASVPGQAAIIALFCRERGLDARALGLSLLTFDDVVESLLYQAKYHHLKANAHVSVSLQRVREIVTYDFKTANNMKGLSEDQLKLVKQNHHAFLPRLKEMVEGEVDTRMVREVLRRTFPL